MFGHSKSLFPFIPDKQWQMVSWLGYLQHQKAHYNMVSTHRYCITGYIVHVTWNYITELSPLLQQLLTIYRISSALWILKLSWKLRKTLRHLSPSKRNVPNIYNFKNDFIIRSSYYSMAYHWPLNSTPLLSSPPLPSSPLSSPFPSITSILTLPSPLLPFLPLSLLPFILLSPYFCIWFSFWFLAFYIE